MKKENKQIIFLLTDGTILAKYPIALYEPGDIKETRKLLAKKMKCSLEDIKVKITGIQGHRPKSDGIINIKLIDSKTIKDFFQ